jgi:hypothetical protein
MLKNKYTELLGLNATFLEKIFPDSPDSSLPPNVIYCPIAS